jgi:dihydroxyacetone kinase
MNASTHTIIKGQNVIVQKDWDKTKTALICGGGSGHEPAHLGFCGKGLLTACVVGKVFASPTVG